MRGWFVAQAVVEAYGVLSDSTKRIHYDALLAVTNSAPILH